MPIDPDLQKLIPDLATLRPEDLSEAEKLSLLPAADRNRLLSRYSEDQLMNLKYDWDFWARPDQKFPDQNELQNHGLTDWSILVILSGRGAGKTRTGSELTREWVRRNPHQEIALVAATPRDARDVMVTGISGLLNIHPPSEKPTYQPSNRLLSWPNGTVAHIYSAAEPDDIRGANPAFSWLDELPKFKYLEDTWSNLRLALRGGINPKTIITTTPQPLPLYRKLAEGSIPGVIMRRVSTFRNAANLPETYLHEIYDQYNGTRLGQQELFGEIISDIEGALWNWDMIEAAQITSIPVVIVRTIVAVDPSGTKNGDECGIIVAGLGSNNHVYILDDLSGQYSPEEWASKVVGAYHQYHADRVVAETNFGADMVAQILRSRDAYIPFRPLTASRGKQQRAEPVAALYERNLVHHNGHFSDLERELTTWIPANPAFSPGRLDALCWACHSLLLTRMSGQVEILSPLDLLTPQPNLPGGQVA